MEDKDLKRHNDMKLNWRAWGSWFSWGSPIGLSLGYAIFIISTGIFLYLLYLSGLLRG